MIHIPFLGEYYPFAGTTPYTKPIPNPCPHLENLFSGGSLEDSNPFSYSGRQSLEAMKLLVVILYWVQTDVVSPQTSLSQTTDTNLATQSLLQAVWDMVFMKYALRGDCQLLLATSAMLNSYSVHVGYAYVQIRSGVVDRWLPSLRSICGKGVGWGGGMVVATIDHILNQRGR